MPEITVWDIDGYSFRITSLVPNLVTAQIVVDGILEKKNGTKMEIKGLVIGLDKSAIFASLMSGKLSLDLISPKTVMKALLSAGSGTIEAAREQAR
jgi:hypothetical protein